MSGAERIARPQKVARDDSLVTLLRDAGIHVPDQELMARLMDAVSLGFNLIDYPDPYCFRIRFAVLKRMRRWYRLHAGRPDRNLHEWKVFDYSEYVGRSRGTLDYGSNNIPQRIKRFASVVRTALPGVELKVHATYSDPVLEARYRGEKIFLKCWRGQHIVI